MQAQQFLESAIKKEIPPVIALVGDEKELHAEIIKQITKLRLSDTQNAGPEYVDANETSVFGILDSVATVGLFANDRVVAVMNAESLSAGSGSPPLTALERYLEEPNPSVTLIFSLKSAHKGKQPFKSLLARAQVVQCDRLKGADLQKWVSNYIASRGYRFAGNTLGQALLLLGNDLMMIKNALDKLMLYCGERSLIEISDVEQTLGNMREHAVWELTAAIGARNKLEALQNLSHLLNEGKHPLQIISALQFQFRQLITVKSLLLKKRTIPEIVKEAGIRFYAERIIKQAKSFSTPELVQAYDSLFTMENSIKSAGIDERFLLEKNIIEICTAKTEQFAGARG